MAFVLFVASAFNWVTVQFYLISVIEGFLGTACLLAWYWFRKTSDLTVAGWTVSTITGLIAITLLIYTRGQFDSYALIIIYPLIAYPLHGVRNASIVYTIFSLIVVGTIIYGAYHWVFVSAISTLFNVLVVLLIGGGIILYNERVKEEALKKAYDTAMTDALTGIWNRTMFEQAIKQEIENSRRYHQPFTLILSDLDHFKRVNDNFGHHVGDMVLQEFASIIQQRKRLVDHLSRWGGEEFALILPNTRLADAEKVASSLMEEVRNYQFSGIGSLTVSMGIGEFNHQTDRNNFFNDVDQALYQAKQSGRNRYCSSSQLQLN